MQSGMSNDGTEEQYLKITKLSWCGISSSTCEKQQLPEDQTELKEVKKIWICDMACPHVQQNNIETKRIEKMTKYRHYNFTASEVWT